VACTDNDERGVSTRLKASWATTSIQNHKISARTTGIEQCRCARTHSNIGLFNRIGRDLPVKRVELLKEAVPTIKRLGLAVNPLNPSGAQARTATSRLGMDFKSFDVREAKDFEKVFSAMAKARVDSILVSTDTLFQSHASKIASLAKTYRLASVGSTQFAEAGGLIGYGVNDAELFRRGAYFVHRILTGSKPGDLPIEQPTRFEMVVNAKTATALGIAIPKSVLIRADREIA
jgi:putative ABC transport system substrate-binding protein